ncbi:MAG: 23S rRNA (uracil(1939)-C(5))-methyltransferase RlmD [Hungatella sp.]
MKKGEVYQAVVEELDFPNKGILHIDGEKVVVKNALPGQKIELLINKKRNGKCEGMLMEVLEKAPSETEAHLCPHFGICGGCMFQSIPYEAQLQMKDAQVRELMDRVCEDYVYEGIKASPLAEHYRNKMEFSFGDEYKDGPLALGMHRRGSFYDIVTLSECRLVQEDFIEILKATRAYFADLKISFYKKMKQIGYLRHLLVRRATKTGEILIDLVTTTQESPDLTAYKKILLELPLQGKIVGILHTSNDSIADVVQSDRTDILYGQDFFYEELLGLTFKISPFSFFQTNSLGAEVLYETVRGYVGDTKGQIVFDLYSGTGTIAQMIAPVAKKVIGVEIVPEAVEAAKVNAKVNGLCNCEFIAGDVLSVIDEIPDKPDLIILDPPRDGLHAKALDKIIHYGVEHLVYISCKPTSLARDLVILQAQGYRVEKICAVDMFPSTANVETCVLLSHKNS